MGPIHIERQRRNDVRAPPGDDARFTLGAAVVISPATSIRRRPRLCRGPPLAWEMGRTRKRLPRRNGAATISASAPIRRVRRRFWVATRGGRGQPRRRGGCSTPSSAAPRRTLMLQGETIARSLSLRGVGGIGGLGGEGCHDAAPGALSNNCSDARPLEATKCQKKHIHPQKCRVLSRFVAGMGRRAQRGRVVSRLFSWGSCRGRIDVAGRVKPRVECRARPCQVRAAAFHGSLGCATIAGCRHRTSS